MEKENYETIFENEEVEIASLKGQHIWGIAKIKENNKFGVIVNGNVFHKLEAKSFDDAFLEAKKDAIEILYEFVVAVNGGILETKQK